MKLGADVALGEALLLYVDQNIPSALPSYPVFMNVEAPCSVLGPMDPLTDRLAANDR